MRVLWTDAALEDLNAQTEYIAQYNPSKAAELFQHVLDVVDNLARFPLLGREGRVAGTRELIIGNTPYIVAYRLRDNFAEVVAVKHAAQNWPTHF